MKGGMKKLFQLLSNESGVRPVLNFTEDAIVSSVEYDSRQVKQDSLFVAVEGFLSDGHDYIGDAVAAGAKAIVVLDKRAEDFAYLKDQGVILLAGPDTRKSLSALASAYYDYPSKKMKVIGITGTNGKTSSTYMVEAALKACGCRVGVVGTINSRWNDKVYPAANTTPESKDLQHLLADMVKDGVEYVVMEVSSHSLALDRVASVDFTAAAFTNLTGEHLDFHKTMDNYFAAKLKLFELLQMSSCENKAAVINIDDEYGKKLFAACKNFSYQTQGFGLGRDAYFRADETCIENKITGLSYVIANPFTGEKINLKCAGGFQLYNSLTALALLAMMEIPFAKIKQGLEAVAGVPGRFQVIHSAKGISAVVDYAHTGDAIDKLLASINAMKTGRVITVFGCGGDRDKSKRPVMGSIACEKSDEVIITSDNPRTENADDIIADIVKGIAKNNYRSIADRKQAIAAAVASANPGDIIVVAGKGHENYQIVGKTKIHFDDAEELETAFAAEGK